MIKIKKQFLKRVNTKDGMVSDWYWRKKYNTLLGQNELLKEVMRDSIYKKVIETISQPMELAKYKKENTRLRNMLITLRENRNGLIKEIKELKKEKGISYNINDTHKLKEKEERKEHR